MVLAAAIRVETAGAVIAAAGGAAGNFGAVRTVPGPVVIPVLEEWIELRCVCGAPSVGVVVDLDLVAGGHSDSGCQSKSGNEKLHGDLVSVFDREKLRSWTLSARILQ